jgi:hypothetical protein
MPKLCPRSELDPSMCAHCRKDEPPTATVLAGVLWAQALRDVRSLPEQRPVTIVPAPTTARLEVRRRFNSRIHQVPTSNYYGHAVSA